MTERLRGPGVTVRRSRYAMARRSSSHSDRARFSGRPRADRDLRGGRCWTRCPALRAGSRDPGRAAKGVAGPQEREAGEAAHQGCRAAKIALAPQAALVSLHGFLQTPTARLAGPAACPYRLRRTLTDPWTRGRDRSVKPVWTARQTREMTVRARVRPAIRIVLRGTSTLFMHPLPTARLRFASYCCTGSFSAEGPWRR